MEFVVKKVKYHQAQTIYPSTPKSCLSTLVSLPGPVKYGKNETNSLFIEKNQNKFTKLIRKSFY